MASCGWRPGMLLKHPTVHSTSPTRKDYLAPNVSNFRLHCLAQKLTVPSLFSNVCIISQFSLCIHTGLLSVQPKHAFPFLKSYLFLQFLFIVRIPLVLFKTSILPIHEAVFDNTFSQYSPKIISLELEKFFKGALF